MSLTAMDLVSAAKQQIQEIDVAAAQQYLGKTVFLDVREPQEFAAGHLPGAINLPRGVLELRLEAIPELKDVRHDTVVVYCQTGGRSALATQTLQLLGFTHAVSMAGGFKAWAE